MASLMMQEAKDSKRFEKLVKIRKQLSTKKKTNICKVSANDSQLNDIVKNFNEGKTYKKMINLK